MTPFDAITEVAHEVLGLKPESIKYARGGNAHKWTPLFVGPNIPSVLCFIPHYSRETQGPELCRKDGKPGVDCAWYSEDPIKHPEAKPVLRTTRCKTTFLKYPPFVADQADCLYEVRQLTCFCKTGSIFQPDLLKVAGQNFRARTSLKRLAKCVDEHRFISNGDSPSKFQYEFGLASCGLADMYIGGKSVSLRLGALCGL